LPDVLAGFGVATALKLAIHGYDIAVYYHSDRSAPVPWLLRGTRQE
jgi:hypothetical protein